MSEIRIKTTGIKGLRDAVKGAKLIGCFISAKTSPDGWCDLEGNNIFAPCEIVKVGRKYITVSCEGDEFKVKEDGYRYEDACMWYTISDKKSDNDLK